MAETTPIRILIADDQQDIIDALRLLLLDEGYEVTPARLAGRGARAARGVGLRPGRSSISITRATRRPARKGST